MTAGGRRGFGQAGLLITGLLCLGLLAACPQRPSTPESRAVYFVEKMIREPQAIEDMQAVAVFPADRGPDAFLDELPVRTVLAYLRARARLGAELGIQSGGASDAGQDRRRVAVLVTEGLAIGASEVTHLQVELTRRDSQWMVTRLAAD